MTHSTQEKFAIEMFNLRTKLFEQNTTGDFYPIVSRKILGFSFIPADDKKNFIVKIIQEFIDTRPGINFITYLNSYLKDTFEDSIAYRSLQQHIYQAILQHFKENPNDITQILSQYLGIHVAISDKIIYALVALFIRYCSEPSISENHDYNIHSQFKNYYERLFSAQGDGYVLVKHLRQVFALHLSQDINSNNESVLRLKNLFAQEYNSAIELKLCHGETEDIATLFFTRIKGNADYREIMVAAISSMFLDSNEQIRILLAEKILGFGVVNDTLQDQFIKELIESFANNCVEHNIFIDIDNKYEGIKSYIAEKGADSTLATSVACYNDMHANLATNLLKHMREYFGFLFPNPGVFSNPGDERYLEANLKRFAQVVFSNKTCDDKSNLLASLFNVFYLPKKTNVLQQQNQSPHWCKSFYQWLNNAIQEPFIRSMATSLAIQSHLNLQNEAFANPIFDGLNVVNVLRGRESAQKINSFFTALYQPLLPLWREFTEVVPAEKNTLAQIMRLLIPIVIAGVIVALSFSLVSSLVAMPAIFELVMFFPSLYLGLIVASAFIALKDYLYAQMLQLSYSDKYEAPEYQISNIMFERFGEGVAENIRNYYITEFKLLEKVKESPAWQKPASDELNNFKQNITEREAEVIKEWTEIHTDNTITTEKLVDTLYKRMLQGLVILYEIDEQNRNNYLTIYCGAMHANLLPPTDDFFSGIKFEEIKQSIKIQHSQRELIRGILEFLEEFNQAKLDKEKNEEIENGVNNRSRSPFNLW